MRYKLCKFCENRARDQFWGSYTLVVAPMGAKFGMEEGPLLHAKFHQFTQRLILRFFAAQGRRVAPMGVKFRQFTQRPKVPSSLPNFTPIGATCRPCGAKNLKIGL